MKKLLIMLCLSCGFMHISAQENTFHKKVHGAYLAESFLQSGFRLGYSHEIWKKDRIKKSNKRFPDGKSKTKSIALLYQAGFYSRKRLYTSIPMTASLVYTSTRAKGFMTQYALGVGYDKTVLRSTTYEVDELGTVSEQKLAGSGYLSSQFTLGLGIDFTKFSNPIPIGILYKNSLFIKHGYNDSAMPFWLTDIELTYTLNYKKS